MEAEKEKKPTDSNIKRLSTGLIGFPLVALIFIVGNKYMISVGLAIIAILSMHEYLHAVSQKANPIKWISYLSCALISLLGFVPQEQYGNIILAVIPIVLLLLFLQVIITGMKTNFNDLVYTFMGIIYIAFFVGSMAMIRGLENGRILIWYVIFAGWVTDIFAYAIGRKFGKHKFSEVSPKKSIEGSVAGTVGAIIVVLIYTYFINSYTRVEYSYLYISIIALILSVIGQIGDFAASAIKRYVDIKDYSNLIPGHGGMLDRIDSLMFIAPFAYILLNLL